MTFNLLAGPTGASGPDNGIERVAGGAVSSPVSYIDLTLPAGYRKFRVEFTGLLYSVDDLFAFAFSQDAGVTFINDGSNFDSYRHSGANYRAADLASVVQGRYNDGLIDAIYSTGTLPQMVAFDFDPGSAARWPGGFITGVGDETAILTPSFFYATVNPSATVTPTLARANLLRCLPYGNADCNPPTSGKTIISGSYVLWGML